MAAEGLKDIISIFLREWPVLKFCFDNIIAIHEQHDKFEYLVERIFRYLVRNKHPTTEELADIIDDIFSREFDMLIEDGSSDLIAEEIVSGYLEYLKGNGENFIEYAQARLMRIKNNITIYTSEPEEHTSSDEESTENVYNS